VEVEAGDSPKKDVQQPVALPQYRAHLLLPGPCFSSKVKTASPISPSPLTKSASLSDGTAAVWNDFLYHVFSDHAKSVYNSGPEGNAVDGSGTGGADYECISSESGMSLSLIFRFLGNSCLK